MNHKKENEATNNSSIDLNLGSSEKDRKDQQLKQNIYQICASAIDKYPNILKRMSNVELYYLCENFLERDKYNKQKRTTNETEEKLISFAKEECVGMNDIEELKNNDFNSLKEYVKDKKNLLGKGVEKNIFKVKKQNLLKSYDKKGNITFAISNDHQDKGEINYNAYSDWRICQKILLSLFARQTKYYNTFIMKEIKGNKSINQEEICNNITCNDCVSIVFKNISKKEQHKKIAREFLFYMYDHPKINEFCKRFKLHKNSIFFYQPLSKNRILDKDGHIAYIDLSKIEPNENKDFVDTYNFISDSELIN